MFSWALNEPRWFVIEKPHRLSKFSNVDTFLGLKSKARFTLSLDPLYSKQHDKKRDVCNIIVSINVGQVRLCSYKGLDDVARRGKCLLAKGSVGACGSAGITLSPYLSCTGNVIFTSSGRGRETCDDSRCRHFVYFFSFLPCRERRMLNERESILQYSSWRITCSSMFVI